MGTGDVELFPSDAQLTVEIITGLQEENQKLKDKLDRIKLIVNDDWICKGRPYHVLQMVKEVLEKE